MSTLPLAFQKEIVAELAAEDALLIMAKGLGLRSIIGAFLQIYSQPQNLVLLINTNAEDEEAFRDDHLRSSNVGQGGTYFRSITSELSLAERGELYRFGGVMAITSRILVMDLLTGRIPVHLVTGLLVANAHRVSATSTEAFILRLFRQGNSEGFVKAFSDQPEVFSSGFSTLEKTLKLLYLRKVNLWPRFHITVTESLESHATDVIEIRQPMTKAMKTIQSSIIDCMDSCLQELRRSSMAIEMDVEELTVEKALFKSFDVIIRKQLDPIWHKVSIKTKQLVGDLKTLRTLLGYLVSYDSVNFNLYLETILATQTPNSGSYWLMTDPADKIYSTAKGRVFLHQAGYVDPDDSNMLPNMRPILEELPKWNVLSEIMDEVELEMHHAPNQEGLDTVLIMTQDQRVCTQLKRYLSTPKSTSQTRGKPLMRELLHGYLRWKSNMKHFKDNVVNKGQPTQGTQFTALRGGTSGTTRGAPSNKRRRVRGGSNMLAPVTKHTAASFEKEAEVIATFIQATQDDPASTAFVHDNELEEIDDFTDYFGLVEPSKLVLIHSYNGESDSRLLENIKPRFIIMYDPNATFVRCIEVYKASHPGKQVRVYFTVYDNSVEEQLYLSALRREKDAFTKLIRDKSRSESEPDALQAQAVGVDPDQEIESAFNLTPQDLLRSLPGITSKNYKHVMSNVESIRELAEMDHPQLIALLGDGPAQSLWNFFHKDSRLDMVGLPARGKTHVSRSLSRYLRWLGVQTKVFSVGNYRRKIIGVEVTNDFFSPSNTATADLRIKVANACLDDMILWFAGGGQVGILDGSNTTEERRKVLVGRLKTAGIHYMFIESICDNPAIIDANIRSVKLTSPDYVGWKDTDAVQDFKRRINNHLPYYQTISEPELSFVKLINVGERIIVNNVHGFLQSKIVYYLTNLHISPRKIYFARSGISLNEQSYRADAPLAPAGHRYAENLKNFVVTLRENQNLPLNNNSTADAPRQLTVWTSSRKSSFQTAAHFLDHEEIIVRQRSVLSERNPGVCDQMTTEEIEQKYPDELLRAQNDPYRHRFPRAESYYDLANRLERVILELEREKNDVLIIAHDSVIRCLYGYLFGLAGRDIPSLEIPESTLMELIPTAYKTQETRHVIPDSVSGVNWLLQADTYLSLAGKVPASPVCFGQYRETSINRAHIDSIEATSPSSPLSLSKGFINSAKKQQSYHDEPGSEFRI
ncbi:hypothetical protein BGZ76_010671 [Entomortierella beljakovae]|nr:hypothetical protein BGZ76_010671 [Entomortierella beljakovae]